MTCYLLGNLYDLILSFKILPNRINCEFLLPLNAHSWDLQIRHTDSNYGVTLYFESDPTVFFTSLGQFENVVTHISCILFIPPLESVRFNIAVLCKLPFTLSHAVFLSLCETKGTSFQDSYVSWNHWERKTSQSPAAVLLCALMSYRLM